MFVKQSVFLTFSSFLMAFPLCAQTISSRLVDAKTQKGIPYATIQYGEGQGVITNEEGRFSFVLEEGTILPDSIFVTSMGEEIWNDRYRLIVI